MNQLGNLHECGGAAFWSEHVSRQEAGELSARQYCLEHGLAVASFYYWRRKLEHQASGAPVAPAPHAPHSEQFIEVTRLVASRSQWTMEVQLAGGAVIRLARGGDPEDLAHAAQVLS